MLPSKHDTYAFQSGLIQLEHLYKRAFEAHSGTIRTLPTERGPSDLKVSVRYRMSSRLTCWHLDQRSWVERRLDVQNVPQGLAGGRGGSFSTAPHRIYPAFFSINIAQVLNMTRSEVCAMSSSVCWSGEMKQPWTPTDEVHTRHGPCICTADAATQDRSRACAYHLIMFPTFLSSRQRLGCAMTEMRDFVSKPYMWHGLPETLQNVRSNNFTFTTQLRRKDQ